MDPILRWAGGKRQLLSELKEIIEPKLIGTNRYYEPFIGGGSLAFHFEYENTVINDFNSELINVYNVVKKHPKKLINELILHKSNHQVQGNYFYDIRNWDRQADYSIKSTVERAGRIVYLNKTCYNGLYRVNSKGYYNVPKGRSSSSNVDIVMENKITGLSKFLNRKGTIIRNCDFEEAVHDASYGDVIYFDPPYDYEVEGFSAYVENGFSHDDLIRLRNLCDKLIDKGCFVVISNNDTNFVRNSFSNARYTIKEVITKRYINCDGTNRLRASEVIIFG